MIEGGGGGLLERLMEDLRPTTAPQPPAPAGGDRREAERRTEMDRRGERQVLRVEVSRVDELMDAVGDLVFDRTRIERRVLELRALAQDLARTRQSFRDAIARLRHESHPLADRLSEIDGDVADTARRLERALGGLNDEAEGLRRTATVLQEGLTRVRMMPLRWLFARLERLVRDTAREEGKQVTLEMLGESTELDKSVVDQIGDPLLQLLRNAVAHGIEDPAERMAAGKPAAGRITVEARQKGEFVYIDVTDDGRGIDPNVVRERLFTSGRLSSQAAAAMSDDDAIGAIFERGFSTRAAADRLAGRGIGLDVVRESLARLGGTITVGSQPKILTIFTIRLPLTTAIAQALLFKIGGNVYALPAAHVVESAQVAAPLGRTVTLRNEALPVVDLHLLLSADPPLTRRRTVIALSFGDRRFAITCDKVVGPRQIVVKSLGPLLKPLPLYAGATISGAGKVQLILDLAELAAQLGRDRPAFPRFEVTDPVVERRARILVADDSRSVREAVTMILAQAGYRVDAVPDGWEAWEALQDGAYDLLMTDLEMPRLAGYELIAKLRRDNELRSLPVLVISSRGAQPNRARAEAAGAQGFIAKPINRRAIVDRVAEALRRSR
jgi:chemotaxis protein histidine kinase CheA/ActR/RegA family two-component response regulator